MSRKFAVTRTVEKTEAIALIFDKIHAEPFNDVVTIGHKLTDDRAVERAVRKVVEANPNLKLIEVVSYGTVSQLLGITEEDFMAHAVPLDPKTRKHIDLSKPLELDPATANSMETFDDY